MFGIFGGKPKRISPKAGAEPEYDVDEQTGVVYRRRLEEPGDTAMARLSFVYLLLALAGLFLLLLDTWSGRNAALSALGFDTARLRLPAFRLMAYVTIGGAMGATLDGIRSNIFWHSEREAYGGRFIWRDLTLPLCGAAVGLIAYVAVRSGAGVVDGDLSFDGKTGGAAMVGFGMAAVAGFSYRQMFRWLDAQASRVFSVNQEVLVPDLKGVSVDEAKKSLAQWKLKLGRISYAKEAAHGDKVIVQTPGPGLKVMQGSVVDITIGHGSARPGGD